MNKYVTLSVCVTLLIILALFSLGSGSLSIPFYKVLTILFSEDETHRIVILNLRLPRTLMAILIGASLGVAGAVLQGVFRNSLASPELMGITGGATVFAVLFMTYLVSYFPIQALPMFALAGSFITATCIYLFAYKQSGTTPYRLILVGIGLSTAMAALTMFLLISGPSYLASQILGWMTGTIYGKSMDHVLALLPWTLIFLPLAFFQSRHLDVLLLGDGVSRGLGMSVQAKNIFLLLISVVLGGTAVGFAGGISFIGLMAPHMARKLVGPIHRHLLPISALLGAIILLLSDLAGRLLFQPLDLPAGIFTAAIGAPFFLYLLFKK